MRFPKQIASLGRFSTHITFCVHLLASMPRNENTQQIVLEVILRNTKQPNTRYACGLFFGVAVQLDFYQT